MHDPLVWVVFFINLIPIILYNQQTPQASGHASFVSTGNASLMRIQATLVHAKGISYLMGLDHMEWKESTKKKGGRGHRFRYKQCVLSTLSPTVTQGSHAGAKDIASLSDRYLFATYPRYNLFPSTCSFGAKYYKNFKHAMNKSAIARGFTLF